ncbi:dTDP-glucose 4,6-dehydratase [Chloroflexota bacterium]
MQNVLVTGGAGFIGSNFIRHLLMFNSEVRIVNLDALTYAGSTENLKDLPHPDRHKFIHGDIGDRPLVEELLEKHAIDTIVHFAAETHVDRSILGPAQFVETNVVGTFSLLEAARKYWLEDQTLPIQEVRFHHISTDEVFGSLEPGDPAFSEKTPYAPNSPYAASKAASDHLVRSYGRTYGLPFSITNCSNNFGPYQFPEKLIPLMITNLLKGLPLPVYGDGKQIRDWLYVEDHCEAILAVIQSGKPGETYIVGGNNQPTNLLVVKTLCEIMDECVPNSTFKPHESLIQYVMDRPGHDRRYAMNITKISDELGWQPRQSLSEGLLKTVLWYLERQDWVDAIQKRGDYQEWVESNYEQRGELP